MPLPHEAAATWGSVHARSGNEDLARPYLEQGRRRPDQQGVSRSAGAPFATGLPRGNGSTNPGSDASGHAAVKGASRFPVGARQAGETGSSPHRPAIQPSMRDRRSLTLVRAASMRSVRASMPSMRALGPASSCRTGVTASPPVRRRQGRRIPGTRSLLPIAPEGDRPGSPLLPAFSLDVVAPLYTRIRMPRLKSAVQTRRRAVACAPSNLRRTLRRRRACFVRGGCAPAPAAPQHRRHARFGPRRPLFNTAPAALRTAICRPGRLAHAAACDVPSPVLPAVAIFVPQLLSYENRQVDAYGVVSGQRHPAPTSCLAQAPVPAIVCAPETDRRFRARD